MQSKPRELVRKIARRELVDPSDELQELTTDDQEKFELLVGTLFTAAIILRLGEKPSNTMITEYIWELRQDPETKNRIKPLFLEAVMRFTYGDEQILRGVEDRAHWPVQVPVIQKIVPGSEIGDNIDEYLDGIEKLLVLLD